MSLGSIDPDDFTPQGTAEADKHLLVRFFTKDVHDKTASAKAGHPVYREKEYIEIRVPGKRDPQACRPATHQDINRFPEHYERFKKRTEEPTEGWPLKEWAQLTKGQVEQFSFLHIKTVEQLANIADSALGDIKGGLMFKQAAQKALDERNSGDKLRNEIEELKKQNAELKDSLQLLLAKAKQDEEEVEDQEEVDEVEEVENEDEEVEEVEKPVEKKDQPPRQSKRRSRKK